ncbi:MAG: hypothetical protein ABFC63_02445 [Thermoguttaceae bacterium]
MPNRRQKRCGASQCGGRPVARQLYRAGRQPSSSSAETAGTLHEAGWTGLTAALATRRLFGSGSVGAGSEFGFTSPLGRGPNSVPVAGLSASPWNVRGVVGGAAWGAAWGAVVEGIGIGWTIGPATLGSVVAGWLITGCPIAG